jgi:hypothetical protein
LLPCCCSSLSCGVPCNGLNSMCALSHTTRYQHAVATSMPSTVALERTGMFVPGF